MNNNYLHLGNVMVTAANMLPSARSVVAALEIAAEVEKIVESRDNAEKRIRALEVDVARKDRDVETLALLLRRVQDCARKNDLRITYDLLNDINREFETPESDSDDE